MQTLNSMFIRLLSQMIREREYQQNKSHSIYEQQVLNMNDLNWTGTILHGQLTQELRICVANNQICS